MFEAVDVEVYRGVDHGEQVRHVGNTVHPDWPVKVGLLLINELIIDNLSLGPHQLPC